MSLPQFLYGVLKITADTNLQAYFGSYDNNGCYEGYDLGASISNCGGLHSPNIYQFKFNYRDMPSSPYGSYCASAAGNPADGITPPCSQTIYNPAYPASPSNGGMTIYNYYGGNPFIIPIVGANTYGQSIPKVGGRYPIEMTSTLWNQTQMGWYASGTYEAIFGDHPNGTSTGGFLIVAYPSSWVTSFEDLDVFAPSNLTQSDTSPFYNQGSRGNPYNLDSNGNPDPSDTNFYFMNPDGTKGNPVPTLESFWYPLLQTFCGTPLTCNTPPCSYMLMGARPGGGVNYCNQVYTSSISKATGVAPCSGSGQSSCSTGQQCVDNICLTPCINQPQCPSGYVCDGTYCQPPLPPDVTQAEIDATSTIIQNYCDYFKKNNLPIPKNVFVTILKACRLIIIS